MPCCMQEPMSVLSPWTATTQPAATTRASHCSSWNMEGVLHGMRMCVCVWCCCVVLSQVIMLTVVAVVVWNLQVLFDRKWDPDFNPDIKVTNDGKTAIHNRKWRNEDRKNITITTLLFCFFRYCVAALLSLFLFDCIDYCFFTVHVTMSCTSCYSASVLYIFRC